MSQVFVSYRRANEALVGRLTDRLMGRYGQNAVFRDVSSLDYAVDFPDELAAAIRRCDVFLLAIGPDWAQRLEHPEDYVRLEVEQAVSERKKILPVLLDGVAMPKPEDLPASIARITRLNAPRVRAGNDFESDVSSLGGVLERMSKDLRPLQGQGARQPVIAPAAVALVALVAGGVLLYTMLSHAHTLAEYRLTGNLWFALLVVLGVAAAFALFGTLSAFASWEGVVIAGPLKLGGPPVVFFLVVVLGHVLIPAPPDRFTFTLFFHGPSGQQDVLVTQGASASIHIPDDVRSEVLGTKGEARFMSLPAGLRGSKVRVGLSDTDYELATPNQAVKLEGDASNVAARLKELPIAGTVYDKSMKPLRGAQVMVGDQTAHTDTTGRFRLAFRARSGTQLPVSVSAEGFKPLRTHGTLGAISQEYLLIAE